MNFMLTKDQNGFGVVNYKVDLGNRPLL